MRHLIRATVVALVTLACAWVPAAGGAAPRPKLPGDYYEWQKVAVCEEGGWNAAVSWVPRSVNDIGGYTIMGISGRNWIGYSRALGLSVALPKPGATTLAERVHAIRIGDAIEHGYVPDQNGCEGSW